MAHKQSIARIIDCKLPSLRRCARARSLAAALSAVTATVSPATAQELEWAISAGGERGAALPVLADDESVVTGCLQNGRLTQLAIGNTPANPCRPRAEEVTFPLAGQQPSPDFETPFFVAMIVGDEDIVVGENGPLEAVARCFPSPASGLPRSRLLIRSSVDGWAITQAIDPTRSNLFDLPAGEQPIGGFTTLIPEIGGAFGASAIAPDGSVLTVDGDTTLVGMHVFDDFDCVMAGVVTMISHSGDE